MLEVSDSPGARAPTPAELHELQVFVRLGAALNAPGRDRLRRAGAADQSAWAPRLGVLVFAAGVVVANSAPPRSFPGMLLVLCAAWAGQVVGNAVFGGYVSAVLGALVMTPVAAWVARLPSAMPRQALFLPGFWLLVPGALGLIGLTQLAGDSRSAGTDDLVATVVSLFAVAIGILCGSILLGLVRATRSYVDERRLPRP
jgi:uncharacterized membrane protein YjjB (DUF3815 family)